MAAKKAARRKVPTRQPRELAARRSLPPRGQMGRVQTLGSQEGADLTRLGAGVGLAQDLHLVLRREPTPSSFRRHFDILRYDGCFCYCVHDESLARPLH